MEPKNLESAMVAAIENIAHKRFGVAIIVCLMLERAEAPAWMIFGTGLAYLAVVLAQDAWSQWLHRDDAPAGPAVVQG